MNAGASLFRLNRPRDAYVFFAVALGQFPPDDSNASIWNMYISVLRTLAKAAFDLEKFDFSDILFLIFSYKHILIFTLITIFRETNYRIRLYIEKPEGFETVDVFYK